MFHAAGLHGPLSHAVSCLTPTIVENYFWTIMSWIYFLGPNGLNILSNKHLQTHAILAFHLILLHGVCHSRRELNGKLPLHPYLTSEFLSSAWVQSYKLSPYAHTVNWYLLGPHLSNLQIVCSFADKACNLCLVIFRKFNQITHQWVISIKNLRYNFNLNSG